MARQWRVVRQAFSLTRVARAAKRTSEFCESFMGRPPHAGAAVAWKGRLMRCTVLGSTTTDQAITTSNLRCAASRHSASKAGRLLRCVLFPVVSYIPRVVLSATIMVIAIQHVDPWSIDLVRRIRTSTLRHRNLMLLDLLVMGVVAVLSVTINIVLAVFLGLLVAVALFIVRMGRSIIHRNYRCDNIHSRKTRTPVELALLEKHGADILVLELQGVLFFGSAEMLSDDTSNARPSPVRARSFSTCGA